MLSNAATLKYDDDVDGGLADFRARFVLMSISHYTLLIIARNPKQLGVR